MEAELQDSDPIWHSQGGHLKYKSGPWTAPTAMAELQNSATLTGIQVT